jgi:hypothetical protein
MKKLTLVSIVLHGKTYSGFFLLNPDKPQVSWSEVEKKFNLEIPRGTTVTIG